ncbi:MAG TPA: protein-methionine-sulfoxide reductase heme-binding subunit MsrQ [Candidatus Acidoferrum sp.]|nr:protein-methionine-sulfoxide reductase heme-binding subunit MsrQ [Candidatus Acidoferrum sp.]
MHTFLVSKWTKAALFLLCFGPLAAIVWPFVRHYTIPNPLEFIQHATGDWTLRFLVFTLTITPLRQLLRLPELIRFRRMLGLFAFFYACLHFTTYLWFDKLFDAHEIWKDVYKRPFITVGFLAFTLLIPLAITSTAGWIRRLGGRRWRILHRAIYISAVCGVIHYYWQVKSAVIRPLFYGAMVGLLLAWRVGEWLLRRRRTALANAMRQQTPVNASQ